MIEEELGLELEQLFLEFEETPIAAASIGQVHRAVLPNGERVAVKVQRPDAPRQIEADLALLYQAARVVRERVRALDFIDARELVDEFAQQIRQRARLHARRTQRRDVPAQLRRHRRSRPRAEGLLDATHGIGADARVPRWDPGRRPRPSDWPLERRRETAYRMTDAWMAMIFRHGFFHGDPHPANVLVLPDGEIGLVDFGAVGRSPTPT